MSKVHNDNKQKKKVLECYITVHLIGIPIVAPELLYMHLYCLREPLRLEMLECMGLAAIMGSVTNEEQIEISSISELSREALKA